LTLRHFDTAYHARAQDEHDQILAALETGDAERARQAVRDHLAHNQRHVGRLILRYRLPAAPA
jgi:DNA-binding GntR family transcriptional regulator